MRYFTPKLGFKWLLAGFLGLLGILIPLTALGDSLFNINFDPPTYELGDLNGQDSWTAYGLYQVVNDVKQGGTQAGYINGDTSSRDATRYHTSALTTGIQSFYVYWDGTRTGGTNQSFYRLRNEDTEILCVFGFKYNTGTSKWEFLYQQGVDPYGLVVIDDDVAIDTWHAIQVDFDKNNWQYRLKLDGGSWSDWFAFYDYINQGTTEGIKGFTFATYGMKLWFDTMGGELSVQPYIEATSPASGTTITDLDDNITIKFYNIDPEVYDGLLVGFRDDKLQVSSETYQFKELGNGTGQFTIPLSTFGFDSNRKWWLRGMAYSTHLDIEGGMFLTTRGYVDFFSDDLVVDPYYLLLDVEGLPTAYTFTDPEEWYSANVERFDTPTQLFTSFVGLMSPVFEKVGDLGVWSETMLDKNEAYDRGYALGEIFPLINGYIQKIDRFFGGFPLASFFKYLILVMLAIFIIRAVMKFIPFLGGS